MKISVSLHNAPKKGEDQNLRQVIFRVREGNNDLKVRTDLMADPTLWDESVPGYRRTTKLGKGGTKAFNDKLQDIFRLIEADFTPIKNGSPGVAPQTSKQFPSGIILSSYFRRLSFDSLDAV